MPSICQKCIGTTGGCCIDARFTIHISELEPFKRVFESDSSSIKEHKLEKYDGEEVFLYDSQGKPCVFLSKEGECTIYEDRPLTCRLYPLLWKERSRYIDFACPLAHIIPVKEIMGWLEEKENEEQIRNMEALDFNERLAQYLSFSHVRKISECLELVYNRV
ncbi:MAG: YkgJ family cysteine cluster protein [Promethearchaeota archaeon]